MEGRFESVGLRVEGRMGDLGKARKAPNNDSLLDPL